MQKHKILVLIAAALAVGITTYHKGSQAATVEHFLNKYPDFDPKLVKKHYNTMLRDVVSGKLDADDLDSDGLDNELYRRCYTSIR